MRVLVAVVFAFLAVVQAQAGANGVGLEVSDAWVREAPPGAPASAGYLVLKNVGEESVSIVSAKADRFGVVEFHSMVMEGGMMKMRALKEVNIPKGETLIFEPGGLHIMFKQPQGKVKAGDVVSVTLSTPSGKSQVISFDVKKDM